MRDSHVIIRVKAALVLASLALWGLTPSAEPQPIAGTPTGLTAVVTGTRVMLSWSPAPGDPTTYVIEAGSASGLADLANFATGSLATTFTAVGVPSGTYFVRVRSANAAGASPPSNEVTVVVAAGPCPVLPAPALTATVRGTTITLNWTADARSTSFHLEAGSAPGLADLFNADIGRPAGNTLTVTAAPGVYYVRIRARNACGLSAASAEITITVTGGGSVTIGFLNSGGNGSPFVSHTESGFTVTATESNWTVRTTYGNPAPFIQFQRLATEDTISGEVRVTAGGAAFSFEAVDLYSSITTIPYVFTGLRGSTTVFTVTGTVPNTFGGFVTVTNPDRAARIDTLLIKLLNPATPCCSNPVGLDNIVLSF
jgi:hypothetical protein